MKWMILSGALVVIVGCSEQSTAKDEWVANSAFESRGCVEPENPYPPGTGHHAGFEWAEARNVGSCGGNSASFVAGCEKYVEQAAAYEECSAR